MKNIYKLIFALITILPFTSCEEVIDVDLETGQTLAVAQGMITNNPGPHYVKLGTTSPYFLNEAPPVISNAIVSITEVSPDGVENFTEPLTESAETPGLYFTGNWEGKVDHNYILNFEWNGDEYTAESLLKKPITFDSLTVKYKPEFFFFEAGFYITWYWQEVDEPDPNFYRFKIFANDTLLGGSRNVNILDDVLVNGNYIDNEIGASFKPSDTVRIEVYSITQEYFNFFVEMSQQINNGGLFANPPANVQTNIRNVDPNGKTAVGFFSACGLHSAEIIMPDEIPVP